MEFIRPSANNVSRCFQGHKIPRPEERGTRSPEALLLHTSFLAREKKCLPLIYFIHVFQIPLGWSTTTRPGSLIMAIQ